VTERRSVEDNIAVRKDYIRGLSMRLFLLGQVIFPANRCHYKGKGNVFTVFSQVPRHEDV